MDALLALPAARQRKAAAVLGGIVGEAAGRPLHWNYDGEKLKAAIAGVEDYAFLPENASPFYNQPTGENGYFGDYGKCYLRALAEKPEPDTAGFVAQLQKMFGGDDNPYQITMAERAKHPDSYQTGWVAQGPWLSHVTKDFLEACAADPRPEKLGAEGGKDLDGYCSTLALTAFLAPDPTDDGKTAEFNEAPIRDAMEQLILEPCGVLRNLFLSELLTKALSSAAPLDVVATVTAMKDALLAKGDDNSKTVAAEVELVLAQAGNQDHLALVAEWGKGCPTPGSFQGVLHSVLISTGDYRASILAEIGAGGDSCGRPLATGSLVAAMHGLAAIPADYVAKTTAGEEVMAQCAKVFA